MNPWTARTVPGAVAPLCRCCSAGAAGGGRGGGGGGGGGGEEEGGVDGARSCGDSRAGGCCWWLSPVGLAAWSVFLEGQPGWRVRVEKATGFHK
ncbi:PREDICTED: POU domain, class 4, transcription factor 2-like [Ficedula albicollis]|uniref:POU domain, class 4, transcription factor 2-like n=1 Tax=Ficedula albicollis TaxID=59894 RepID=UPI0007AD8782|nr:PREDICTED: POU domain, class 4, transcription factor 2-like [Ficedula albicollis]